MKKLFALLSTLAVLPVFADEYTLPAAAEQPATTAQPVAQPKAATPTPSPANSAVSTTPGGKPLEQPRTTSTATVARAQFTTAVQDREPTDKVSTLLNDKSRIYFFTEIKDAPNQKITHRWEHDGKVVHEMSFDVGSSRWRVYSNKTLDPKQTGEWKVSVVDEAGNTLGASTFTYEAVKAPAPNQPAVAPATGQPAAPAVAPPKP